VFALGMGDSLVGVSHECDFPAEAAKLPKVTSSRIPPGLSGSEIDSAVTAALDSSGSLYDLDVELLDRLQPDLIVTQSLCDVCAVSVDLVDDTVKRLKSRPAVLNLDPHSLEQIFGGIRSLAQALHCEAAADSVIGKLEARVDAVRLLTKDCSSRPRVLCMEWVSPPYCGGHWMKELVEIAGGRDDLSHHHRPSYRIEWSRILEFSPEVIVLTCCGFSLERCRQEAEILAQYEGVQDLPAARSGRIFATDGSSYFSRSGPRIVDSLEILAHVIHPELFAAPPLTDAFAPLCLATAAAFHA
jgi:iron complex transport system substrate-binding protein